MQPRRHSGCEHASNVAQQIFNAVPLLKRRLSDLCATPQAHDMPYSQLQLLTFLNECGAMSMTDISQKFGIAKPNITPLIDRMTAAGYVLRERGTADRRVVNVVLCEAGREKLNEIRKTFDEQAHIFTKALTDAELLELSAALDSVVRLMSIL